MSQYLHLGKFSFGMGDRFGHQGRAQLRACVLATELGAEFIPVWNKSNREHSFIGTEPSSLRAEADDAVKALGWKKPYHVDADHIRLETVDRFIAPSDFFTIDVADSIGKPAGAAVRQYQRRVDNALVKGAVTVDHLQALYDLGYLPLEIRSLPEGARVDIRVPPVTFVNTRPEFAWLVTYIETLFSCESWKPSTVATIAFEYRKLLTYFARVTGSPMDFVNWQGHDFSMRGMAGAEAAIASAMGHLVAFTGTETVPVLSALPYYYPNSGFLAGTVPATEHSVMCAGGKEDEMETFQRLLDLYPTQILSVVSDTWDYWNVLTNILPALKDQILARGANGGKLVVRPDSGDPADIICGTVQYGGKDHYEATDRRNFTPAEKGSIEVLWDIFGGEVNEQGYKVLTPQLVLFTVMP